MVSAGASLCPHVHKVVLRKAGTFWAVSSVGGTFWAVSGIDGTFWAVSSVGGTFWAVSRVGGTLLPVLRVGTFGGIWSWRYILAQPVKPKYGGIVRR